MKFQIDHDLHIHSNISLCASDPLQTPENILAYAKENNLKHICLTDHLWDEKIPGASEWLGKQNIPHVMQALPLPTDDEVRFDFGCEIDMDKHFNLTLHPDNFDKFDFIVVAVNHLHMTGYTVEAEDNSVERRAELIIARTHALLDMDLPFERVGLAHFTDPLGAYYSEGTRDEMFAKIPDSELYKLFRRVAEKGVGVELNFGPDDAENKYVLNTYRIAKECGCKFYLGSDAHTTKARGRAMQRFTAMLSALDLDESDKFTYPKR